VESTVDIKDFILIGGGLLIAAVVAHGFWIAWRERRQDLRIDIKPDLIPDEVDEIERLRGELPNGGARVAKRPDPQQEPLELETPPLALEPVDAPPLNQSRPAVRREPAFEAPERADPAEVDAVLFGSDWRNAVEEEDAGERREPVLSTGADEPAGREALDTPMIADSGAGARGGATERSKVAEVAMPEPIVADEPKRPRRLSSRKAGERAATKRSRAVSEEQREAPAASMPVEELIVMNVLAENDRPFTGDELFATLRTCGLKFGDMNIFHRVEPLTKSVQYSVANAVEPGTFDMADMEAIRCAGLCFFMQLPGPEDPSAAFEDMLSVAKSVVKGLGGEVRDEHRNIMTPQTVEHYRARIVDFSRRRMSKRA
jgi:cell division protein ZipA